MKVKTNLLTLLVLVFVIVSITSSLIKLNSQEVRIEKTTSAKATVELNLVKPEDLQPKTTQSNAQVTLNVVK